MLLRERWSANPELPPGIELGTLEYAPVKPKVPPTEPTFAELLYFGCDTRNAGECVAAVNTYKC